jgi:hypothetical protein
MLRKRQSLHAKRRWTHGTTEGASDEYPRRRKDRIVVQAITGDRASGKQCERRNSILVKVVAHPPCQFAAGFGQMKSV